MTSIIGIGIIAITTEIVTFGSTIKIKPPTSSHQNNSGIFELRCLTFFRFSKERVVVYNVTDNIIAFLQ